MNSNFDGSVISFLIFLVNLFMMQAIPGQITIDISDVNDNPPVCSAGSRNVLIAEGTTTGNSVSKIDSDIQCHVVHSKKYGYIQLQ